MKLDDLRNRIQDIKDQIEQNQIKTTLKKVAGRQENLQEVTNFNLTVKKTINNRESKEPGSTKK